MISKLKIKIELMTSNTVEKLQSHKIIAYLFLVFIIFPIISYSLIIIKDRNYMLSKFSVMINYAYDDIVIKSDLLLLERAVLVQRVHYNNKLFLLAKNGKQYFNQGAFTKGIRIIIPELLYNNIEIIKVVIGDDKKWNIEKDQILKYFNLEKKSNHIILETRNDIFSSNSVYHFFSSLINYKGDQLLYLYPLKNNVLFLIWAVLILTIIVSPIEYLKVLVNRQINLDSTIKKLILFFLLSLLNIVLLIKFTPALYINDDIGIINFIQSGNPVVFMSTILGNMFSFLHIHVTSKVPWYSLYHYFFNIIILYYVFIILYRFSSSIGFLVASYTAFVITYSFFLVNITFTVTGLMIGSVVILLFCMSIDYMTYTKALGLGLLFAHSYLFRTKSFFAILIFAAPIIIFFISNHYKKLIKISLFFFPIVIAIVGNTCMNRFIVPKEHKNYVQFNTLRGALHDFPILRANIDNKTILEKNNWTENDYLMFDNWMFWDEDKFNTNTLKNIFKYSVDVKKEYLSSTVIIDIMKPLWIIYQYYLLLIFGILIFIFFYYSKKIFLIFFCYFLYAISGFVWLEMFYRFPERIGVPLFLFVILSSLFLLKEQQYVLNINTVRFKTVSLALLLIFSIDYSINLSFPRIIDRSNRIRDNIAFINTMQKKYNDYIIVSQPGYGIPSTLVNPIFYNESSINIIGGGWTTFSPYFYERLEDNNAKLGKDIFNLLARNNNNVLFLGTENGAEIIKNYLLENSYKNVDYFLFDEFNGREIWKFISKLE